MCILFEKEEKNLRWHVQSPSPSTGRRQKTPPRVVENSTQAFGKSHPGFWKSARTQLGIFQKLGWPSLKLSLRKKILYWTFQETSDYFNKYFFFFTYINLARHSVAIFSTFLLKLVNSRKYIHTVHAKFVVFQNPGWTQTLGGIFHNPGWSFSCLPPPLRPSGRHIR